MNIENFISTKKSIIIAPAGYGKTHSIAECLEYIQKNELGRHLILTHTHAGVHSIKEKLKKLNIDSKNYNVETISSFTQKFVHSYYIGEIPSQDNEKKYYPFILKEVLPILNKSIIKEVIKYSYKGMFVDEYQDCTIYQHNVILALSEIIPTHILGDYLQGIFKFGVDRLVDLESKDDMGDFLVNSQELSIPWRWKNANNESLGYQLADIRKKLENDETINLSEYDSIELIPFTDDKDFSRIFSKTFYDALNVTSDILVIDPNTSSINTRIKLLKRLRIKPYLLEAIDEKVFYKFAKKFDGITKENIYKTVLEFFFAVSDKTSVKSWFSKKNVIQKQKYKPYSQKLNRIISELEVKIEKYNLVELFNIYSKLPNLKIYRKDLFYSIRSSIEKSINDNSKVFDAMIKQRNTIRRSGKKEHKTCIGTTLLTKGLEYDTVIISDVQKFDDKKNFYVAITRASKKLIILSESPIIKFTEKSKKKEIAIQNLQLKLFD